MSTTSFSEPRRRVARTVGGLGAVVVAGHHAPLVAAVIGCVVWARPTRVSPSTEVGRVAQRLAVAVVAGALLRPPFATWARTGAAGLVAYAVVVAATAAGARFRRSSLTDGEPTLLAGEAEEVSRAAQLFTSHPEHQVRVVATATPDGQLPTVLPGGSYADTPRLVERHQIRHVVAVSGSAGGVLDGYSRVRPDHVRISVLPGGAEALTAGSHIVDVRGLPFVCLRPRSEQSRVAWIVKRIFDRVAAAVLLVALSPLMAIVAVAIRLDDHGPAFFRQARVGRNGRLFSMLKFRSMIVNAEAQLPELQARNEGNGPFFKIADDPRTTRVGRFIRRTSIDELPQLWNVLRGEMSLVGPRPCLPAELEASPEALGWRVGVLPGMTGLWQIAGRSRLPVREGTRMDLTYVESWSLGLDARILLRTCLVALRNERRPSVSARDAGEPLSSSRYAGRVEQPAALLSTLSAPTDVSVVVVTHESEEDIGACLRSLRRLPDEAAREVIVVDNRSTDASADIVERDFPEVRLIRKRTRDGFSVNNNIGATAASGRYLFLLNPDTEIQPGTLDALVAHLDANPHVAAVGPRLVYPDGRHQPSARRFPSVAATLVRRTPLRKVIAETPATRRHLMADLDMRTPVAVDWMLGAALLVRRTAFEQLGGLDEGYRLYCEDIDFCLRLHRAGWGVEYLPTVKVQHALGEVTFRRFVTRRTLWHLRSMSRFVRLHGFTVRLSPPPLTLDLTGMTCERISPARTVGDLLGLVSADRDPRRDQLSA